MRDYYSSYLEKNIEISQGSEGAKGAKAPSAPFAPALDRNISENFSHEIPSAPFAPSSTEEIVEKNGLEDCVLTSEDLEQFEERIAIMIYDGGMPENEAEVLARADFRSS